MNPLSTFITESESVNGRYAIGNRNMLRLLDEQFARLDKVTTGKDIVYGWRLDWKAEDGTPEREWVYCSSYELDEGIHISSHIGTKHNIPPNEPLSVEARLHGFRRIKHLVAEANVHNAVNIKELDKMLQDHIQQYHPILSVGSELSVFEITSGRIVKFLIKSVFIANGETQYGFAMDSEYSVDIKVPAGKIEVPLTINPAPTPAPASVPMPVPDSVFYPSIGRADLNPLAGHFGDPNGGMVFRPPSISGSNPVYIRPPSVPPSARYDPIDPIGGTGTPLYDAPQAPVQLTPEQLREARLKYFSRPNNQV